MEFLSNKPLLITDTILRDAHQSQAATRMTTADMLPALEMLDSIGYYSLECWGGATFDACMRFLNENPWERLRTIRQHVTVSYTHLSASSPLKKRICSKSSAFWMIAAKIFT